MKHNKSSLFLMEMIICILFFSICAAVCVQLFSKSHTISKTTIDENQGVIQLESLAEAFYNEYGDLETIGDLYYSGAYRPIFSEDGNDCVALYIYYDKDYHQISLPDKQVPSGYCYVSKITLVDDLDMNKSGKSLYFSESIVCALAEFYAISTSDSTPSEVLIYSLDLKVNSPNTIENTQEK